jgi:hypothetical protein
MIMRVTNKPEVVYTEMRTSGRVRMLRISLGRTIIHFGLRVLPGGRVRSELYQLIDEWATKVLKTIGRDENDRAS